MEHVYQYGLFLAQTLTFVIAALLLVAGLVALGQR
ncbi:MAG TPA: protease SohB, partial [Halieaceae bacterium]|nr:protease SohB [Halieaceae bacterium]